MTADITPASGALTISATQKDCCYTSIANTILNVPVVL